MEWHCGDAGHSENVRKWYNFWGQAHVARFWSAPRSGGGNSGRCFFPLTTVSKAWADPRLGPIMQEGVQVGPGPSCRSVDLGWGLSYPNLSSCHQLATITPFPRNYRLKPQSFETQQETKAFISPQHSKQQVYLSWIGFKLKQRGGGDLNPIISQPQYMVHSLNPARLQSF